MAQYDLLLRASRVLLPDGERPATIAVSNGRIAAVLDLGTTCSAKTVIEIESDKVLLPGLVDSHVHICEPGNTEWEGFLTATRAAAAGGITTLVDMPLDSVPTTVTHDALEAKRRAAEGQCYVDVGFWGGAIPTNLADLPKLHHAGVLGFKSFLCDTGTDDFPGITPEHMHAVIKVVAALGSIFIVHAESAAAMADIAPVRTREYAKFLASRPSGIENLAIAEVIEAARSTGAHAHILHLSSADALPMIASAIADGVRISVETCPHYLTIAAEHIADGDTAAKVGPPIRSERNRNALWKGITDGTIDMIVSDHSPCTPEMKETATGDFAAAWGGISSLQLGLPLIWTEAQRRGFLLSDVMRWMAERPAILAGLPNKGRIAVGYDADFAVFAPDASFVVEPEKLHHRHPITPYLGRTLNGVVHATFVRGKKVNLTGAPAGTLIARPGQTPPTATAERLRSA